jgi:hypothetical protein
MLVLPSGRFDQRQTFTTPVTDGRDHRLLDRPLHRAFDA